MFVFFFKQKTAYEMRISDWSSDVCSSDLFRPMFGAFGRAATHSAVTFLSGAAHTGGVAEKLGLSKPTLAVCNTRGGLGTASMVHNSATPKIEVDPETYEVRAHVEMLTCASAEVLPPASRKSVVMEKQ